MKSSGVGTREPGEQEEVVNRRGKHFAQARINLMKQQLQAKENSEQPRTFFLQLRPGALFYMA